MTTPASGVTFTWYGCASSYEYSVTALSPEANIVSTSHGGATATEGEGSGTETTATIKITTTGSRRLGSSTPFPA